MAAIQCAITSRDFTVAHAMRARMASIPENSSVSKGTGLREFSWNRSNVPSERMMLALSIGNSGGGSGEEGGVSLLEAADEVVGEQSICLPFVAPATSMLSTCDSVAAIGCARRRCSSEMNIKEGQGRCAVSPLSPPTKTLKLCRVRVWAIIYREPTRACAKRVVVQLCSSKRIVSDR